MTPPAAFITGGSSGIGLELAVQLAKREVPIALFARDSDRLSNAVEVIAQMCPAATVRTYPVDVGDRTDCEAAVARAIADLGAPGWAIANAGISVPGRFLDQDIDLHEAHMRINYLGALYFARAVAQPLAETAGHLVFVASGAAFFGIYGYSAYAPSKFAMRGLAEVLRLELAPENVTVTLAYPPDTDTPMLEAENCVKPAVTRAITASGGLWSARDVARLILRRAEQGKFTVAPGFQMKALLMLHSLLGPGLRAWQRGLIRRAGRSDR